MFSKFAKWISLKLGHPNTFGCAIILVFLWVLCGPFFHYSDTWQLVINTFSSIVTFLMVFIIQNTQNRDTTALHLKLDEIIRAMEHTHNEILKIEDLSDQELSEWRKRYTNLAKDVKMRSDRGESDVGIPDITK